MEDSERSENKVIQAQIASSFSRINICDPLARRRHNCKLAWRASGDEQEIGFRYSESLKCEQEGKGTGQSDNAEACGGETGSHGGGNGGGDGTVAAGSRDAGNLGGEAAGGHTGAIAMPEEYVSQLSHCVDRSSASVDMKANEDGGQVLLPVVPMRLAANGLGGGWLCRGRRTMAVVVVVGRGGCDSSGRAGGSPGRSARGHGRTLTVPS